jgi:type I restriction enzyme, S subunit
MRTDWRESTWGDEITLEYGKALRGHEASTGHCRVFGSNGPIGWTDRALAPGPGVILGRKGAYRGVHYSAEPFFVIDTAYYVSPRSDADMRWLYYAIRHYKLGEIDDGSPIPSTTRSAVYVQPLTVPPLDTQRAVARILGSLDDKIDLNRRMSETLEAMARAIFISWFVDFDPVRAKAEGRDPKVPADIVAHFPSSFRKSSIGEIPTGWNSWRVEEVGKVVCGKTPSTEVREFYGSEVQFITIPDMHGKVFVIQAGRSLSSAGAASQAAKTLPPGTICVSCIATPGLVVLTSSAAQTNQQINSVIPSDPTHTYYWFWCFRHLGGDIQRGGSGGSVLSNLSTGRFSQLEVLAATQHLRSAYHDLVSPLFQRILGIQQHSATLATIRDALLPKLISGEIRIKQEERAVEALL